MGATFVKGRRVTVTKVLAGPCVVTQVKNMEKDGYWAVQLGFGQRRIKNITKPMQGHLKGAIKDKKAPRFLAEVRLSEEPDLAVGDKVVASDIFNAGDIVSISGTSKGKGFQGVVKRWGFAGGPRTHGQSDRERAPGSIGQGTTPGRVYKGKHMAGRMGAGQITIKNLQVVSVDPENNLVEISGSVPGARGSLLKITRTSKGELEGIQEVQAKVVEGEAPAGEVAVEGEVAAAEGGAEAPSQEAPKVEGKQNE
ncbi:50S ribosomal protein L3 [Candidatus Woesebacteria bacterium GWC1_42_13]|nr:MAG: 50S ribosomal protein L3 [Candidatus Woesebacteria bacterium GWC1_42_13]